MLVSAAVLAGCVLAPGAAATDGRQLVVRAQGTAFVTLDLPAGGRVDTGRWSLTGKGNYKVAVLDRVVGNRADSGWTLLLADVPRLGTQGRIALGVLGERGMAAVPAGRYRLHIVSDAPASLRLPVVGIPGRDNTATSASKVQVRLGALTPPAGLVGPYAAQARTPFRLGTDFVFQAVQWRFSGLPGPQRVAVDACVAARGQDCRGDGQETNDVRTSTASDVLTVSRIQDTFDHTFRGPAQAVTHYEGTARPVEVVHLTVVVPTGPARLDL